MSRSFAYADVPETHTPDALSADLAELERLLRARGLTMSAAYHGRSLDGGPSRCWRAVATPVWPVDEPICAHGATLEEALLALEYVLRSGSAGVALLTSRAGR